MKEQKVFYLIPDIKKSEFSFVKMLRWCRRGRLLEYINLKVFPAHKPIGGVKVIFQHCLMLRELGIDAIPVKMGNYEGNFYSYDIEVVNFKDVKSKITENDFVVASEFCPYEGLLFRKAYKIVFVQNWINLKRCLRKKDQQKSYLDIGYDEVWSCSDYTSNVISKQMGIKAVSISNGIDCKKFVPNESLRVPGRILCMPRKNPEDINTIRRMFGKELNIVEADALTEAELILEYQRSDIFLATGYPEGFGLPPLEAMSCGCAVVGFAGGGATEYMIDGETALVAEDGDCIAAASKLDQLLRNKSLLESIRNNGLRKAEGYDLKKTQQKLEKTLSRSGLLFLKRGWI